MYFSNEQKISGGISAYFKFTYDGRDFRHFPEMVGEIVL